jgi:hypothetical protein
MEADKEQITIVRKEMGITHKDFYGELPTLLNGIPYYQSEDTIKFQLNHKNAEIILGPEGVRELGQSVRLPVTFVTLRFFEFSEEDVSCFIKHFNLRFMKGGG